MQILQNIVYFLISLNEINNNKEVVDRITNKAKIAIYFLQLSGYVFSQYESKQLFYQEVDYLAQISQSSSFTFLLVIVYNDFLTMTVFILIFSGILSILLYIILNARQMKIRQKIEQKSIINNLILIFFANFYWCLLTPVQEIFMGMITCGDDSYLEININIEAQDCFQSLSLFALILSVSGSIICNLLGLLSIYCFRNSKFKQNDLFRTFANQNFLIITLHQLLIIFNYWKIYIPGNVLVHFLYISLILVNFYDGLFNLPFGMNDDTIFFLQCCSISLILEFNVAIWIFSDLDDSFMFFDIIIPIVVFLFPIIQFSIPLVSSYLEQYIRKKCQIFLKLRNLLHADICLEYLYTLSQEKQFYSQDKIKLLYYLNVHCSNCTDLVCPCKNRASRFLNFNGSISQQKILDWIQYNFMDCIRECQLKKNMNGKFGKIQEFNHNEQLVIKFLTFLQKSRKNSVLSFRSVYQIMDSFYKQDNQKQVSIYFNCLAKIIQMNDKMEIFLENTKNIKITQNEYLVISDVTSINNYGDYITSKLVKLCQSYIQLWNKYINQNIQNYDSLLRIIQNISHQNQLISKQFKQFQTQRVSSIKTTYSLRLEIVVSLMCQEDLQKIIILEKQWLNLEMDQIQESKLIEFNNHCFLNGKAVSLISNISSSQMGLIEQKITPQFMNFFGYSDCKFNFTRVEQTLPNRLAQIHDGLVDGYFYKGYTNRVNAISETFIINKNNLIEKVNLCLSNFFPTLRNNNYSLYMIAHLLKINHIDYHQLDQNRKGYILADQQFRIFGITQNIIERVNYKYYYKGDLDHLLIQPQQIYDNTTLLELVPDSQRYLIQFYQYAQLKEVRKFNSVEQICIKEKGILLPSVNILETKHNTSQLIDQKISISGTLQYLQNVEENNVQHQKIYPIEFSISQKILYPLIKNQLKDFLYYQLELEFLEERSNYQLQSLVNKNVDHSPSLSNMIQRQQTYQVMDSAKFKSSQQLISSEFKNQTDQIIEIEQTNEMTKFNSENITQLAKKVTLQLDNHSFCKAFKVYSAWFMLQQFLLLFTILGILLIFIQKKEIQSDCLTFIQNNIDFLDIYSEVLSGSRHLIYYRDFSKHLDPTIIQMDQEYLNISVLDSITISQQHIKNGLQRLADIDYQYLTMLLTLDPVKFKFFSINYDLSQKSTILDSQAQYFQIMSEIFYWGRVTFQSNPSMFLQGMNDTFMIFYSRAVTYYNFFYLANYTQQLVNNCEQYNQYNNQTLDELTLYLFLLIYLVCFFMSVFLLIKLRNLKQLIKSQIKLFSLCDQDDGEFALQLYESFQDILKIDNILFLQKQFKPIVNYTKFTLEKIANSQMPKEGKSQQFNKKSGNFIMNKHISFKKQVTQIFIIFIFQLTFGIVFQVYYNYISAGIAPLVDQALEAQGIRLNFIIGLERWETYLLQQMYEKRVEIQSDLNHNIIGNSKLMKNMGIDLETVLGDIKIFQKNSFLELLYDDQNNNQFKLSEYEQNILLGQDICQLNVCNREIYGLQERLYYEIFKSYFVFGVGDMFQKIGQIIKEDSLLLDSNIDSSVFLKYVQIMYQSKDYFIYVVWGKDIIQFQIEQFSKVFLNHSLGILSQMTDNNVFIILVSGFIALVMIIGIQISIIASLFQKYRLSKNMLKFIPLSVLFGRNIHKHLETIDRKFNK